jgi:hypothetical protein
MVVKALRAVTTVGGPVHFLNLFLKLNKSSFYFALSTNLNDRVFYLIS